HAAFDTTGAVAAAVDPAVGAALDLVVRGRAAAARGAEAVAGLAALARLDAHEDGGEPRVEPAVALRVRAEPGRDAVREHLDDAAERVAGLLAVVDLGDHRGGRRGVEAAHGVRVERRDVVGAGHRRVLGHLDGADPHDVRDEPDAERLLEELRGRGAEGDARRGLARRGALQHGARVVEAVLAHAHEVGVTGARPREGPVARDLAHVARARVDEERLGRHRVRRHDVDPLGPLGVRDLDREGAALRHAVAQPAEDAQLVLLELLARAPPVPQAAAREGGPHVVRRELDARGQPVEDADQRLAVRLTRCQPTQHDRHPPTSAAPSRWAPALRTGPPHGRPWSPWSGTWRRAASRWHRCGAGRGGAVDDGAATWRRTATVPRMVEQGDGTTAGGPGAPWR